MWLVCGLGNPEKKYENTRHNVGFQILDYFAKKHGLEFKLFKDLKSLAIFYHPWGILVKPLTYMNLSGIAIKSWMEKQKIVPENLLLIYDDMDLPLGKFKILPKGGSGGHKGVQSVIEALNTSNFPRIKIGISRPPLGENPKDYVLSPFKEEEVEVIKKIIELVVQAIEDLFQWGLLKTMSKYNSLKVN